MTYFKWLFSSITLICVMSLNLIFAQSPTSLSETQKKLKQLDAKIMQLKKSLVTAQDKRGLLNHELSNNEKKIGAVVKQLRQNQREITTMNLKINQLEKNIIELNNKITKQQALLTHHIRIRHKMGEYQQVKWLLSHNDVSEISQLLTLHQYLVQARQKIITNIDANKQSLHANQTQLSTEMVHLQALQSTLRANQERLERNKQYHTTVMQSLHKDIQSQELQLAEFKKNKDRLSYLLKTLSSQSIVYTKRPFATMQHKLIRPVPKGSAPQRTNQGITFFAGEGTPVYAVHPGKIVFADWLNGYGLLLIIDHGNGFMTLYAHNQSLFKHKGQTVLQGEHIAAVGHSGGGKQNGLYFEIRHHAKVIPPLNWLTA